MDNAGVSDPTQRFTIRAEDYERHRPRYPAALADALFDGFELKPGEVVADVGAGTGIFTEVLLQRGCRVVAVEPNAAMRASLGRLQAAWPALDVVAGAAEATTLPAASVDAVVCVQAFHWFDPARARREFERIVGGPHRTALAWNVRDKAATPFLRDYDRWLIEHAPEYQRMMQGPVDLPVLEAFFAPQGFEARSFPHAVTFDWPGLEGLVRSTSYVPAPGDAAFAPMIAALRGVFDAHQRDGVVTMHYATRLFFGRR
jgi:SAM-dependent methyltransferase